MNSRQLARAQDGAALCKLTALLPTLGTHQSWGHPVISHLIYRNLPCVKSSTVTGPTPGHYGETRKASEKHLYVTTRLWSLLSLKASPQPQRPHLLLLHLLAQPYVSILFLFGGRIYFTCLEWPLVKQSSSKVSPSRQDYKTTALFSTMTLPNSK